MNTEHHFWYMFFIQRTVNMLKIFHVNGRTEYNVDWGILLLIVTVSKCISIKSKSDRKHSTPFTRAVRSAPLMPSCYGWWNLFVLQIVIHFIWWFIVYWFKNEIELRVCTLEHWAVGCRAPATRFILFSWMNEKRKKEKKKTEANRKLNSMKDGSSNAHSKIVQA